MSYSSQARCNAWLWSLPQSSGIHYLTPWVSVHPSDVHSLLLLKQLHKSGTRLALIVALLAMSSVTTTVVSLATTRQYNNATTPALHTAGADPLSGLGGANPPTVIAFSGDGHRTSEIPVAQFTSTEMAVLRRSAAQWKGSALPKTVGGKLRLAFQRFSILRKKDGTISGFGREGFVLTPTGAGMYSWGEELQRQAHING